MALSSAAAVLRSISKGKAAPPLPPLPQQLGDEAVDGLEGWTDDIYIYSYLVMNQYVYIYIYTNSIHGNWNSGLYLGLNFGQAKCL